MFDSLTPNNGQGTPDPLNSNFQGTGRQMLTHGFEEVRTEQITELGGTATLYRHVKTGAEVLSVNNDDKNKVFGIGFTTLPENSNGVAHILEHSVLCGSDNFPVKDPFVQLLKGSYNTFLNAWTFPDATVYPVASTHEHDFENQMRIYLDAVFKPLLKEEAFKQEGWRFEVDDQGELSVNGVVYNEMKAASETAPRIMYRATMSSLYPDTPYAADSGGTPDEIRTLTYEDFKKFHDTYYHPSRSYVVLWGDQDQDRALEILNEYFDGYEKEDRNVDIPAQTPFTQPVRVEVTYAAEPSPDTRRTFVGVNWGLGEIRDTSELMAFDLLDGALLGSPGAPLRRALIESGVGQGLTGSGTMTGQLEASFTVGLSGVDAADVDKAEAVILDSLAEIAKNGIDKDDIDAALNSIEFLLRERDTGGSPQGMFMASSLMHEWRHGVDPFEALAYEELLTELKQSLASNPHFLEEMIEQRILANQHRSTVVVSPDENKAARDAQAEAQFLADAAANMDATALDDVRDMQQRVQVYQSTPDTEEALSTIPRISVSEIEKDIETITTNVEKRHDVERLHNDIETHGIAYIDLSLDLPQDLLQYSTIFGRILSEAGTTEQDYVEFGRRVSISTGGFRAAAQILPVKGSDEITAKMLVGGKATVDKADELIEIMSDALTRVNLDDKDRITQIVNQYKVAKEQEIVPSGHSVAAGRVAAELTSAGHAEEQLAGVSQLEFIRDLSKRIDTDWDGVKADLEAFRDSLVNRSGAVCNVTCSAADLPQFEARLDQLFQDIPVGSAQALKAFNLNSAANNEGLVIPSQVNFVAKGMKLDDPDALYHGSVDVVSKYLNREFLWDALRVKGGAYGGFLSFGALSGTVIGTSYRDPNTVATLETYDRIGEHLENLQLTQEEIDTLIIGAASDADSPQLPPGKGRTAYKRHLIGITDEMRQQRRDELLGTTLEDFHRVGRMLKDMAQKGRAVILGSKGAIDAAAQSSGETYDVTPVL